MDYIARINALLKDWALYPEVRALPVQGKPGYWLLEDPEETTGYRSPEGCSRTLVLLDSTSRPEKPSLQEIGKALNPNMLQDEEQAQIEFQGGGYLWIG